MLDTADPGDAARCGDLIEEAALAVPPPYRPVSGRPVYEICAEDKSFWVAEGELAGPLRDLVMITLIAGARSAGAALGPAAGQRQGDDPATLHTAPAGDVPAPVPD